MRRLIVITAVAVAAIVAVAVVATVASDRRSSSMVPGEGRRDATVGVVSTSGGGVVDVASGAPVAGSADDLEVARTAAVVAVARTSEVFEAGMISRRDLIGEFATERFGPVLAERTSRQVIDLLFGFREAQGRPVDVALVAQPVTATATSMADGRVAVDVWTVAVFVADGSRAAVEQWSTVHLVMASQAGRWLVDDWKMEPGPAPLPPAEGTFAAPDAVAEVIGWSPVGVEDR